MLNWAKCFNVCTQGQCSYNGIYIMHQPKYQHYTHEQWCYSVLFIIECELSHYTRRTHSLVSRPHPSSKRVWWLLRAFLVEKSAAVLIWQANQMVLCPVSISATCEILTWTITGLFNYYQENAYRQFKCLTSEEQTCEQEAASHLDRSGFFYLSALMVGTQCSAYLPVFCTQQHRTQTPTLTLWK